MCNINITVQSVVVSYCTCGLEQSKSHCYDACLQWYLFSTADTSIIILSCVCVSVCNSYLQSWFLLKTPGCHCLQINQLVLIITENTPILCAGRECVLVLFSDAGCHDVCNIIIHYHFVLCPLVRRASCLCCCRSCVF